jgi:hypothetical protein
VAGDGLAQRASRRLLSGVAAIAGAATAIFAERVNRSDLASKRLTLADAISRSEGPVLNLTHLSDGVQRGDLYRMPSTTVTGADTAQRGDAPLMVTGIGDSARRTDQGNFTVTYNTPGTYSFVVPAGVTGIIFSCYGAQGGRGAGGLGPAPPVGALGGRSTCTIATTPGETLTITVGGQGGAASGVTGGAAGSNGGASGGTGGVGGTGGGGGGGASDVRQGGTALANRVCVGAGGGGSGGSSSTNAGGAGGTGGGASGSNGTAGGGVSPGALGSGATTSAGGAGGSTGGVTGSSGSGGAGGGNNNGGGGAGGGKFGGGGGGASSATTGSAGGGGGGSALTSGTNQSTQAGQQSGDGKVSLLFVI